MAIYRCIGEEAISTDISIIQRSMGLSPDQALSITHLQKREAIVSYSDYPFSFKVQVHDFSFTPRLDEPALEKNAQDFLSQVTWTENNELAGDLTDLEAITGDALKVFMRIAEKPETVYERCEALMMNIIHESRARKALIAKGWIDRDEVTIGNKIKIYGLTPKGEALAVRFAGKEAVMKTLGTGAKGVGWREIEILADDRGKPLIYLYGRAHDRAVELGLKDIAISLSHSREYAVASAMGEKSE